MSARENLPPRVLSVSVRECRMFVERILLTCGLPSGYVHGVRDCVLLSEALGLGGLRHLLECHATLRMDRFADLRVRESDDGSLEVDGANLHAWLLLPGVGAQGGKVQDLAAAFDARGLGALVNQSRGVMQCFAPGDRDWRDRIATAAAAFAAECRAVATRRTTVQGNS